MQRLVKLREDVGHPERPGEPLPQDQAAQRAGVTVRQWQRWESGVSVPYARNLSAVADAFGFAVSEFYDGPAGQEPAATPDLFAGGSTEDRLARIEEAVQGTYQLLQQASDARHAQQEEILQRIAALEAAMIRNGDQVADRAVDQVRDLVKQPDEVVQAIESLAAQLHADADLAEAQRADERARRAAPRRSARAAK